MERAGIQYRSLYIVPGYPRSIAPGRRSGRAAPATGLSATALCSAEHARSGHHERFIPRAIRRRFHRWPRRRGQGRRDGAAHPAVAQARPGRGAQAGGLHGGSHAAPMGGGLGGLLGGLLGSGGAPMAGGGGLGGILGGLLGGGAPATGGTGGGLGGMAGHGAGGGLGGLLDGLGGLLGSLRSQGLDRQVDSWVSRDTNQPVSPQDLEGSFDPRELDEAAQHAGTDRAAILAELSNILPHMVDRATPRATFPSARRSWAREAWAGCSET
ncbi:YidB family protein [Teichococcus aestuarii]|uniref:YidB family protein n=1 Tax=Teichococcus aestuarii TaxID=568898 RepID=UPI00360F897D